MYYIGQTSSKLGTRVYQYKSDSKFKPNVCVLATHVHNIGHIMDFENNKVLCIEKHPNKRTFLEIRAIH